MTPDTDRPAAAAAARELARELYMQSGIIEGQNTNAQQFIDWLAAALLSARQAQLEDDCKAVCSMCRGKSDYASREVELIHETWMHLCSNKSVPSWEPWHTTCSANAIRAQAAATKAVSETGEKG